MACIDTSASMTSKMLEDISAELGVMAKTHTVTVVECDKRIHAVYPFKPMENGDFLGQIAQFGSVTGLEKLNQNFESLAGSITSGQALQAGGLVGREVLVPVLPQLTGAFGAALLLGYRLPVNFNRPFLAVTLRDFWRRWHISLSSWLKDYLYIPLGGNRKGRIRTDVNLMITMLLGGLWHGASWQFLVWGGLNGVAMSARYPAGWRVAGRVTRAPEHP